MTPATTPKRGSIPACAGEPRLPPTATLQSGVYPRVCGGTPVTGMPASTIKGLSPRVRGNPIKIINGDSPVRSIPACAGEPRRHLGIPGVSEVYPRVCGGTALCVFGKRFQRGLSPRVRGNPAHWGGCGRRAWSIPACAGEPRPARGLWLARAVYPRVCGGTLWDGESDADDCGLSPRVRGNQPTAAFSGGMPGSIPACAGEPGRCCASGR